MRGRDSLCSKKIFQSFLKKKNDENGRFFILEAMIDDCVFILINMYNPNTEKGQVPTWAKMNLMLQAFDGLENKIIVLGGDICHICRIRNTKEKHFTLTKTSFRFLQRRLVYFFVSITLEESSKFYLRYLLIIIQFYFLQLVPSLHLREKGYGNSIIPSS